MMGRATVDDEASCVGREGENNFSQVVPDTDLFPLYLVNASGKPAMRWLPSFLLKMQITVGKGNDRERVVRVLHGQHRHTRRPFQR